MLGFLLYKIYTRFFQPHDSTPRSRTFYYISINMIIIVLFWYLIFDGVMKNLSIDLNFNRLTYIFIIGALPIGYTYLRFFYKKDIEYYEKKYKDHWLNKVYFDFLLILFPFFVFISGPTLRVVLFGGEMFNRTYDGALKFLFD